MRRLIVRQENLIVPSLVFFLLTAIPLRAQNVYPPSRFLTVENGLSHNTVCSIAQDSTGFLWFGTEDGLNRYDGYSIRKFRPQSATSEAHDIPGERCGALIVWRNRLWAGWDNGELTIFDQDSGTFPAIDSSLALPAIVCFLPADSIHMWVGTIHGLFVLEDERGRFRLRRNASTPGKDLSDDYITAMCRRQDGVFCFATIRGVFLWNGSAGQGEWLQGLRDPEHTLSSDTVQAICSSRSGRVLVGTRRGLDVYSPADGRFSNHLFRGTSVLALHEDPTGDVWVGTASMGIALLKGDSVADVPTTSGKQPLPYDGHRFSILKICPDRFGSIWFGTRESGVGQIVPDRISFTHLASHSADSTVPAQRAVWSLFQPSYGNGTTLLEGTGTSLREIDLAAGKTVRSWHNPYPVRAIQAAGNTEHDGFWVGTLGGGIAKLVPDGTRYRPVARALHNVSPQNGGFVYCLHRAKSGELWIGTNGAGLLSYEPTHGVLVPHPIRANGGSVTWIIAISEAADGAYWLGTWAEGLIRFNPATGEYHHVSFRHPKDSTVADESILVIRQDQRRPEILWLGTNGTGLIEFDTRTEKWAHYLESDGLPSNEVYGLLQDNSGMIWVTTPDGLSRFNPADHSVANFSVADGLSGNDFLLGATLKGLDGRFYVGGRTGINAFFPDGTFNTIEPDIVLTSVRFFNTVVGSVGTTRVELSHDQRFVSFDMTALHYKDPSRNRYSYIMEGLDTAWTSPSSMRHADYPYLPPGHYVFRVRACNADGFWGKGELAVPVDVSPPFWQTLWFWLAVPCVVGAGIYGLQRYRVRRAILLERARTHERDVLRKKMAADFHDELGARAAKISLTANLLSGNGRESIGPQLHLLASDADKLIKEMHEMTWQLDPDKDTMMDLAVFLKEISDDIFGTTDVAFRLKGIDQSFEQIRLPMEWRQNLIRIFKEAMTNALKHAEGCRNVTLNFCTEDSQISVELVDDGKGFDTDCCHRQNGLKNMENRATQMGGTLTVSSVEGKGTSVCFSGKLP